MRRPAAPPRFVCAIFGLLLWSYSPATVAEVPTVAPPANLPVPTAPGLGDPGALRRLRIETGRAASDGFVIAGRDARQQLLVSGEYATGQARDLTRSVAYSIEPFGVASVDSSGLVLPVKEGQATITAKHATGESAQIKVTITHIADDLPVNFPNQVVPVFTKLGCNAGGCHGKMSGQNGFKLSLLGFEPTEDYEHLTKEARGRRLFPASPDRSLLLLKAAGVMPHGGGARMDVDSPNYRILRRWIEQGMPYGSESDPTISSIDVYPSERALNRGAEQQLVVIAKYSDGATEDVTGMTKFEANDPEMAECSASGLIKAQQLTGAVAIMARYQGQVGVARMKIPLGVKVDNLPPAKNFVDELVFKQLTDLGMPPSPVCDDGTFIRRVTVDIAGRLPTPSEVERFATDVDTNKREKWIDGLLASTDYADNFANKWSAILRNKRQTEAYTRGNYLFHDWIRSGLLENKPYDQFVRDILTASGEITENPAVAWYRQVKEPTNQLEDCAQLFLGMRLQCAHCHHHPFEKWSQQDYWGFDAFFTRVGRKKGANPAEDRIFHQRGVALANNPKTKQNVKPTGLASRPLDLSPDQDPRQALVDWMSTPENPFFAPAVANRYWKHFFSRGLVEPEDDMRVTNPASNPELLQALAQHFVARHFDLKDLVRTICTSNTYQLSAEPNLWNASDKQNFSRYYPKRLGAEVLLDSVDIVTGSQSKFNGMPTGTRAIQLPDSSFSSYFLTVFGRPEGSSACECERSSEANLAQSLHLLNSAEIQNKLSAGSGRAAALAADKTNSGEQKIRGLYMAFYARQPLPDELAVAQAHLEKTKNDKIAYEDILWALINTKEFLFNH